MKYISQYKCLKLQQIEGSDAKSEILPTKEQTPKSNNQEPQSPIDKDKIGKKFKPYRSVKPQRR